MLLGSPGKVVPALLEYSRKCCYFLLPILKNGSFFLETAEKHFYVLTQRATALCNKGCGSIRKLEWKLCPCWKLLSLTAVSRYEPFLSFAFPIFVFPNHITLDLGCASL